ncbi:MAG TPA: thioredoxin family protein [Aquabacterium sp.]|nr:thioredoxin family protein [Aquabacterium sp.]
MKRWLWMWALMGCLSSVQAREWPYNESADADAEVKAAVQKARQRHVPVLIVFGANWCPDCRALDAAMNRGANEAFFRQHFDVVKVDVGNFDRHQDLVARFGNPTRQGIPAAVVLSSDGRVVYATQGGELANARRMSEQGIADFFARFVSTEDETH